MILHTFSTNIIDLTSVMNYFEHCTINVISKAKHNCMISIEHMSMYSLYLYRFDELNKTAPRWQ